MKRYLAVPLAALTMAACSDLSTAPAAEEAAEVPTGISASASFSSSIGVQSLDFTSDLNFIDGLVPSFTDASSGARFGELMKELRTHLSTNDKAEASRVLDLARKELATGALNAGDTGYVEFVFRDLGQALAR